MRIFRSKSVHYTIMSEKQVSKKNKKNNLEAVYKNNQDDKKINADFSF